MNPIRAILSEAELMILLWLGVDPKTAVDRGNLGRALGQLMAEEPDLAVKTRQNGVVLLGVASEEQLERIVEQLAGRFGVEAAITDLEVAYKEALTASASGEARYVKQSGGRGHYAHVKLRVHPGQQGSGFVFEHLIAEITEAIPQEFAKPIEDGIAEVLDRGVLAGYPIDDVDVTVYDGSYDELDSSAAAFKIAGALAFVQAAQKARPVLLEPFMHVSITVPPEQESRVHDGLNARRGEVYFLNDGRSESGDPGPARRVTISAELPLSQLLGFDADLRQRTGGLATCSMQFSHYGPATLADDDGDRDATVMEPRRPRTPPHVLRAAVPEPVDDLRCDDETFRPRRA